MTQPAEDNVTTDETQNVTDADLTAAGTTEAPAADAAPAARPAEAPEPVEGTVEDVEQTDWEALAAERTSDLQRLHAEYANYKKRVDRDRAVARQSGIEAVLTDFMPVLDSISLARQHEDVVGGFKMVADELEKVAGKYGLVPFGEVGEEFDPNRHDALMEVPIEGGVSVVTISQVMQQGYLLGDRVIRPARVGVANP